MKNKEKSELKSKSAPELKKILAEDYAKLTKLKFDLAAGKVKNIREARAIKKNIARILTFLKEREDKKQKNA